MVILFDAISSDPGPNGSGKRQILAHRRHLDGLPLVRPTFREACPARFIVRCAPKLRANCRTRTVQLFKPNTMITASLRPTGNRLCPGPVWNHLRRAISDHCARLREAALQTRLLIQKSCCSCTFESVVMLSPRVVARRHSLLLHSIGSRDFPAQQLLDRSSRRDCLGRFLR